MVDVVGVAVEAVEEAEEVAAGVFATKALLMKSSVRFLSLWQFDLRDCAVYLPIVLTSYSKHHSSSFIYPFV